MAQGILYNDSDYKGRSQTLDSSDNNLEEWGWDLNDEVSSFWVVSGNVRFYSDADYKGVKSDDFGPGKYHWVEEVDIVNDTISSVYIWG
jgi:hypothetical protein